MNALLMPDAIGHAVALTGSHLLRRGRGRVRAGDRDLAIHLDRIVSAFERGFLTACRARDVERVRIELGESAPFLRGFAFEGAAMAAGLLDALKPWTSARLPRLLAAAKDYVYLLHVGAGWALARIGRVEGARFARLDPVLKWLAIDGVGFHDGLMRDAPEPLDRRREGLSEYGARAYDQGLGRSLWFTARMRPGDLESAIAAADPARHGDLWSGVGLACAYAGGVDAAQIRSLAAASAGSRAHFAQGVAFGAEAHMRPLGGVPPHTALACGIVCGMSADSAAAFVTHAAADLQPGASRPAYETWRARVRERLS